MSGQARQNRGWGIVVAVVAMGVAGWAERCAAQETVGHFPSSEVLAAMSEAELVQAFNHGMKAHMETQSFAAAEAVLWALRLRFPDNARLPNLEYQYAQDQLFSPYGSKATAVDTLKRFLAGGPYAAKGAVSCEARNLYAAEAAVNGKVDEAVEVCRFNVHRNGDNVAYARPALLALQIIFDLRFDRDEQARGEDLAFCQAELQKLYDWSTRRIADLAPVQAGGSEKPALTSARRTQFLTQRRLNEILESFAMEGTPERLRADLGSHFRMGDRLSKHGGTSMKALERYRTVAQMGEQWLQLPHDSDLARNLDATHYTAISLARTLQSRERDQKAFDLLSTIWSYRNDPAAAEAEPWRVIGWMAVCGNRIGKTAADLRPIYIEALTEGERLSADDINRTFGKLAEWARSEGDEDSAFLYLRDASELLGGETFRRKASEAQATLNREEGKNPAAAQRLEGSRSDVYEMMRANGKLEETDGAWRVKQPDLWGERNRRRGGSEE